ncbi:unnamed protein product, partial [Phaedon cochleariae]
FQEVLRTLQSNKDDPISRNVGPFPRNDDGLYFTEDIQIRPNAIGNRGFRQSKTVDFDIRRKSPTKIHDFKVTGCVKIQLPDEHSLLKLKKNEHIRYQNNVIYKVDDSLTQFSRLKIGVTFKSARVLNKKEVELRDTFNQAYLLIFDSSKDAKNFTETDNVACLFDTEKSTITKTLLRLLGKRSSREVLEKKGIYQNEPIFGNTLKNIYNSENGVPSFILKTMELIERPDNITSLGLYRTSGNLATIQKIRLEVDKGNPGILDNYAKDPDVLTGSLKLFFRELKEPLMSCQTCDNLSCLARNDKNYCKKDKDKVRTILKHLPEANSETLLALVRHLIEVVKYKDQNKMDTYNLAVCWGPTVIFATDASDCSKDLVTQSTEATRLFDALLTFYINNPEELELRKRPRLDSNRNTIHREDSKDSVASSDSSSSWHKKNSSNPNIDIIDEGLRKSVELIENCITTNGLYKKSGSLERTNKIVKKMTKKKTAEMEKYKHDVYELTDSLKKYMREVHEPLVTKEAVEHINKLCDNTRCLDDSTRHMVASIVMDLPKRCSLVFVVKHLIKVIKNEPAHRVPRAEMIAIWSEVLNDRHDQRPVLEARSEFDRFLAILVDVFDDTKGHASTPTMVAKGIPDGLLNDLKNVQKEKDRISKYDNVPDDEGVREKTDEHTKL